MKESQLKERNINILFCKNIKYLNKEIQKISSSNIDISSNTINNNSKFVGETLKRSKKNKNVIYEIRTYY